jgi:hypothetical protein
MDLCLRDQKMLPQYYNRQLAEFQLTSKPRELLLEVLKSRSSLVSFPLHFHEPRRLGVQLVL